MSSYTFTLAVKLFGRPFKSYEIDNEIKLGSIFGENTICYIGEFFKFTKNKKRLEIELSKPIGCLIIRKAYCHYCGQTGDKCRQEKYSCRNKPEQIARQKKSQRFDYF